MIIQTLLIQTLQNFSRLKICTYNQTPYKITTNCHYLKDQSNISSSKIGKFTNIHVSPYHNMIFTVFGIIMWVTHLSL